MTVLVRPHRVKGRTNDVNLDISPKMREKVVFPHLLSDYKNVALFVLRAALPCLPTCISHKRPMLINSLFAYHFASRWILSASRLKNMSFSKSWHQVSGFNEKTMGLSPFLVRDPGFKFQSDFWLGWSPIREGVWFQDNKWYLYEILRHAKLMYTDETSLNRLNSVAFTMVLKWKKTGHRV